MTQYFCAGTHYSAGKSHVWGMKYCCEGHCISTVTLARISEKREFNTFICNEHKSIDCHTCKALNVFGRANLFRKTRFEKVSFGWIESEFLALKSQNVVLSTACVKPKVPKRPFVLFFSFHFCPTRIDFAVQVQCRFKAGVGVWSRRSWEIQRTIRFESLT